MAAMQPANEAKVLIRPGIGQVLAVGGVPVGDGAASDRLPLGRRTRVFGREFRWSGRWINIRWLRLGRWLRDQVRAWRLGDGGRNTRTRRRRVGIVHTRP